MTAPAAAAFDRAAPSYDQVFSDHPTAIAWRRTVWRRIETRLPRRGTLIDVGCGTGVDALHFAELGHAVIAVDVSPAMIALTSGKSAARGAEGVRAHVVDARDPASWEALGLDAGSVDVVYASFGVLNCLPDLGVLATVARRAIAPGGAVVLVPMPRICPREIAGLEWRRLGRAPTATVEGMTVPLVYPTLREIARAFAPDFRIARAAPLGFLAAAPPAPPSPGLLVAIDSVAAVLPVLRGWGDHAIVELSRST
ncbi:MAG: class I SAM-dependent methyltransferase [Acidobacteriota bacterium]